MSIQTEGNFDKQYQSERSGAVTMASFVYAGAVIAGTIIFLFFVLTAFPDTAYFIRGVMVLAGLLVGGSALAFPVALHNWAVTGRHRLITTGFYYGELALFAMNTFVSFATLLFKYAGNGIPDWVAWYEPFTIISLAYVLVAWGTVFITDPQAIAKARQKSAHDSFLLKVAENTEAWIDSNQGRQAIQEAALRRIDSSFGLKPQGPQDWIPNNAGLWTCDYCGGGNPPTMGFCGSCGSPKPKTQARLAPPPPSIPAARPRLSVPPASPVAREYTLAQLLGELGLTKDEAARALDGMGFQSSAQAYGALVNGNYIPSDISLDNFEKLYREIMSGRVNIPTPPAPGKNGSGAPF